MAKFGLSYPVVALLDVTTGTYSGGKVLSKACAVTVTPQYAESSLEADDDAEAEHLKDFTKADVSLEVSNLTAEDETLLFGHKVETDDIVYNGADQGSYVGLGYITRRRVDGKTTYQPVWLLKVLFAEGADENKSSGENLTLESHKLSGTASVGKDGQWKRASKTTFDTKAEAQAWLKKKSGITEDVAE